MAIEHTCPECEERFEVDTGNSHNLRGDGPHRDVECPHCRAEQRVNVRLPRQ